jgi:predicted nucleic acid-binding protein
MVELVSDASVLIAFCLAEDDGQKVQQLIESNARFYAPPFWRFEVSNTVWKRKEIPIEIAKGLIEDIWDFAVYEWLSTKCAKDAFLISRKYNITFYDSSYIAVSKQFDVPLWTLDKVQATAALKAGISLWGK